MKMKNKFFNVLSCGLVTSMLLTGIMENQIYEEDIPNSVGHYTQINTYMCLANEGDDKAFFSVPMILNVDAVEPYNN